MIKTAVIGASGYIGSHLLRKYRELYPDCIGTSFSRYNEGLISFDLRNPDISNFKLFDTGHRAAIIASAMPNVSWCETHPKEAYELNVLGTLKLVKQLTEQSITTIFLSSDYVFDGKLGQYSDHAITCPITEYGKQKAEVERKIPEITDNFLILRLSKIYGTMFRDNTLIDAMANLILMGKKQLVATDQFFSATHVNDIVTMTMYIQNNCKSGLYNLCYPEQYSRAQIGSRLIELLNASPDLLEYVSLHTIPSMKNRPLNTSLLCSPIFNEIRSSLTSIHSSIENVVNNWTSQKILCETK